MIEGSYERSKMNKGTSPRRLASAADAICAANFAGEMMMLSLHEQSPASKSGLKSSETAKQQCRPQRRGPGTPLGESSRLNEEPSAKSRKGLPNGFTTVQLLRTASKSSF